MNFSTRLQNILTENLVLRIAIVALLTSVLVLAVGVARSSAKPALVIDRGCTSLVAALGRPEVTQDEIDAFLKEALVMRFDTKMGLEPGYLSIAEMARREMEFSELESRSISQRILVDQIEVTDEGTFANLERLVTLEKLRSSVPLRVSVDIQTIKRSKTNPYGLILKKVTAVSPDKIKSKESK